MSHRRFAMSYADFADEYMSGWDDVCDSLNADVVDEHGNPNPRDPQVDSRTPAS